MLNGRILVGQRPPRLAVDPGTAPSSGADAQGDGDSGSFVVFLGSSRSQGGSIRVVSCFRCDQTHQHVGQTFLMISHVFRRMIRINAGEASGRGVISIQIVCVGSLMGMWTLPIVVDVVNRPGFAGGSIC